VAIVSSDVAARVWPGQDPIGKRVKWGMPASQARWMTVVGITAPTRYRTLQAATASLYVPAVQMLGGASQLVVRTTMPIAQLADLVRARARDLDPDVSVMPLRPFSDLLQQPFARPRFYTLLMTGFGATGLLLSAIGLYGVIAATVRQRRREIGIRLALGAEARHMRRLVLVEGVALVTAGVLAGLLASVFATRALRSLLFGVHPLDPVALAGAVAGVMLVAAAALVLPLRATGRVAPADVLRAD
jgi:putative ABC transport system permease protein